MATFEVRLVGPKVAPDKVPLHAVSDLLAAIQDMAAARDPFVSRHVPPEQAIGLVDVTSGSAVYKCVSPSPEEAWKNLHVIGAYLAAAEARREEHEPDQLIATLGAIDTVSGIARNMGCRVEVWHPRSGPGPLLTITDRAYENLSQRLFVRGETTVFGKIERAGGATEMRCLLRVPGRQRLLYCSVASKDIVQQLGRHLYENIAATGEATWIHRSWRMLAFEIKSFVKPKLGNPLKAIEELREAGMDAWDQVENVQAYLEDLRS